MIDFLRILLFLMGKVTGDEVGWEWEGLSCRTFSGSGGKFGYGSMQPLKIWQKTFLLAELLLFAVRFRKLTFTNEMKLWS